MTNVIGLNGTKEERYAKWNAMKVLRASIQHDRSTYGSKLKESIDKRQQIYDVIFSSYIKKVA